MTRFVGQLFGGKVAVASLLGLAAAEPFYGVGLPYAHHAYTAYGTPAAYHHAPVLRTSYAPAAPIAVHAARPAVYTAPAVAAVPAVKAYAAQPALPVTSVSTYNEVSATPHATQHHAQDEFGNYEYGYDNPNSAKREQGNADGVVRGSYLIKDMGVARQVNYVADAYGFRASNNRLIKREAEPFYGLYGHTAPAVYGGYALPRPAAVYSAPRAVVVSRQPAVAPVAAVAPAVASVASVKAVSAAPVTQQYHAQDEFGNFEFGYSNPNSQRHEAGNAGNVVKGSYSQIDAFGIPRRVNYVADAYGFRHY